MASTVVNIGSFILKMTGQAKNLAGQPSNYKYTRKTPDFLLRIRSGVFPESIFKTRYFITPTYSVYRCGRYRIFAFRNESGNGLDRFLKLIPDEKRRGTLYVKGYINDPLQYPAGEILNIYLLSMYGGVMVHALGIDYKGKGYIFAGRSGAGKTTLARLIENVKGVKILNDDRVVIRKIGRGYFLFGTPWHGDYGWFNLSKVPLEKIFILRKDLEKKIVPLSGISSMSNLVACSFLPFWDKSGMETTLKFCSGLVSRISCFEYVFPRSLDAEMFLKNQNA